MYGITFSRVNTCYSTVQELHYSVNATAHYWKYQTQCLIVKGLFVYLTESGDVKRDLGHILDFITRVKCLQVSAQAQTTSYLERQVAVHIWCHHILVGTKEDWQVQLHFKRQLDRKKCKSLLGDCSTSRCWFLCSNLQFRC